MFSFYDQFVLKYFVFGNHDHMEDNMICSILLDHLLAIYCHETLFLILYVPVQSGYVPIERMLECSATSKVVQYIYSRVHQIMKLLCIVNLIQNV